MYSISQEVRSFLTEVALFSHRGCALFSQRVRSLSQKNTEEQNTQSFTETLSQPNSQNLTANRGLTPSPSPNGEGSDHRDTPTYPPYVQQPISYYQQASRGNLTYLLPVDPSPFPSPEGKGSDYRDTHVRRMCVSFYYLTGRLVGVTSHITPLPAGEGLGEGPPPHGFEQCVKTFC